MSTVRRSSLKRKLMLINTLTSVGTLLLASVLFFLIAFLGSKKAMDFDVNEIAQMIAYLGKPPLRSGDNAALHRTLNALQVRTHIVYAGVYRMDGSCVDFYQSERFDRTPFPQSILDQISEWRGTPRERGGSGRISRQDILLAPVNLGLRTTGWQPIGPPEAPVGYIIVQRDLSDMYSELKRYSGIVAGILVVACLLALYLSARFQRLITVPIVLLSRTAERVSRTHNYSLRVKRKTSDEIGDLIDCFNGLMARTEDHEHELRRVNEQLVTSQEQALAANRAKSEFLARMSHELRTPLNAILGYSEMLQETAQDDGRAEDFSDLQRIHAAGRHLLMLINDILDLSKIEAGKMEVCLETFSVAEMLQDAVTTIEPLLAKKHNRLETAFDTDLGTMHSDLTKVRQSLFNLLSNACKFTQEGTVTLSAERAPKDGRDWLTFKVRDTGIGMSEEQIARIFQPFSQAETSTSRRYGGTGLGLSITQRFMEMLGGEICVESAPGEGSIFTVRLPAAPEGQAEAVETAPVSSAAVPPLPEDAPVVLVIDDDPNVRDLMTRFLRREGFRAETSEDGEKGLEAARRLRPDVITLDVMMPHMDGWTVLAALKADPETAPIPVVMLTIIDDRDMGYALGAAEYITKPINRERLAEVLAKLRSCRPVCTALLVNGDPETAEALRQTFAEERCIVVEEESGPDALERLGDIRPDLIVTDLMMPGMDGFAFAAELRRNPVWRSIPLVVLTSEALTDEERERLNGSVLRVLETGSSHREEMLREVRDLVASCARRGK